MADIRIDAAAVLACDDRVIALRIEWVGRTRDGGDWSYPMGFVSVIEDGLQLSQDYFEPNDEHGMLLRYAQLGGRPPGLGDRPPERVWARISHGFATDDLEAVVALYTEDQTTVDHRPLPWDPYNGRDGARTTMGSLMQSFPFARLDPAEVLACDDRVIAMRTVWCGRTPDGGDWSVPLGFVTVLQDGLICRQEFFEPEDDHGMRRRYAQLGGRPPGLGDRPPERLWAKLAHGFAAGDLEALVELYADDHSTVDRRPLPWDPFHGKAGARAQHGSVLETLSEARLGSVEVLACDERVIAVRAEWCGRTSDGGDWAMAIGHVSVVEEGLMRGEDLYDPDDRDAMLARYAELASLPLP